MRVVCRFRTVNEYSKASGELLDFKILQNSQIKVRGGTGEEPANFNFDYAFDMDSKQEQVYDVIAKPVMSNIFEGWNGSILAYGQTGSGKTFTMQGSLVQQENKGIIPRIFDHIFDFIESSDEHIEFSVKLSMLEIYMEDIVDLFVLGNKAKLRESPTEGFILEGIEETSIGSADDMIKVFVAGQNNRKVGRTDMNAVSSRSHMISIINISQNDTREGKGIKKGKLYLVDLAGSERLGKTNATGKTAEEGKLINKSLFNLGSVINALTEGAAFVPYRNSKLTRLLQDCFGGNSMTTLIITCSPNLYNVSETISSLRFGVRAKMIKNNVTQNAELSRDQLLKLYEASLVRIKFLEANVAFLEAYIRKDLKAVPPVFKPSAALQSELDGSEPDASTREVTQVSASSPELEAKIEALNETVRDLQERLTAAESRASTAEMKLLAARDTSASLSTQLAGLQEKLVFQNDRMAELEAESNSLKSSLNALSSQLSQREEQAGGRLSFLRASLAESIANYRKLVESDLPSLENAHGLSLQTLRASERSGNLLCNDRVVETLQKLLADRAKLTAQLEEKNQELASLHGEHRLRNTHAQRKLQSFENKILILQKCVEVCRKKFEDLALSKNQPTAITLDLKFEQLDNYASNFQTIDPLAAAGQSNDKTIRIIRGKKKNTDIPEEEEEDNE